MKDFVKKICIPIIGPTASSVEKQLKKALSLGAMVELRLDLIKEKEVLDKWRGHFSKLLLTSRDKKEIVAFTKKLTPDFVDLDERLGATFIRQFIASFPRTRALLSYHNYEKTPHNLETIVQQLKQLDAGEHLYKIACYAQNCSDALRMALLGQKYTNVFALSMGEKGAITRLKHFVEKKEKNFWNFVALNRETASAPGQFSLKELFYIYAPHKLSPQTAYYGLIGGSVKESIGHYVHNHWMRKKKKALYLKIALAPEELPFFLSQAPLLNFRGLSVTTPYKETILSMVDALDKEAEAIGAVNTLLYSQGKWIGYNTDGIGALNAIESKVKVRGKRVAVVGAGGTARAIVYEAKKRGAEVIVINRTYEKAAEIAKQWNIAVGDGNSAYDVLVNATTALLSFTPHRHSVVLDVHTLPLVTPLHKEAMKQQCTLVYGYEMFLHQAHEQFKLWFL